MKEKDVDVLEHIKVYCEDIEAAIKRFGHEKATLEADRDYRNSVCMSLLQIGELTGHLTEDFREKTKTEIFWPAVKGMRNLFAHNYGAIDIERVWETMMSDVPRLYEFCDHTIYRHAKEKE